MRFGTNYVALFDHSDSFCNGLEAMGIAYSIGEETIYGGPTAKRVALAMPFLQWEERKAKLIALAKAEGLGNFVSVIAPDAAGVDYSLDGEELGRFAIGDSMAKGPAGSTLAGTLAFSGAGDYYIFAILSDGSGGGCDSGGCGGCMKRC